MRRTTAIMHHRPARRVALPLTALALLLLAPLGVASAHEGDVRDTAIIHEQGVSLGFAVGDVSGFDMKLWFLPHHGFDMGIGADRFSERVALYGELELGILEWGMGPHARGILYAGPGFEGIVDEPGPDRAIATGPIGVDFQFTAPVNVFVEARPGFILKRHPDPVIGGQTGLRFVF